MTDRTPPRETVSPGRDAGFGQPEKAKPKKRTTTAKPKAPAEPPTEE